MTIQIKIHLAYHGRYIPEEDESEALEKHLEEAIRPLEKLYKRRYTIQIVDNRSSTSRNVSLKNRSSRDGPRFSIEITGERRFTTNPKRADSSRKFASGSARNFGESTRRLRCYSSHSLGSLRGYRRTNFSSFQWLDQKKKKMYEEPEVLPRKTIICLGAVCFATLVAAETAYIDFSPTFFQYYSSIEGEPNHDK